MFMLYAVAGIAWTALWWGRPLQATRLLAAVRSLPEARAPLTDWATARFFAADVTAAQTALGAKAFTATWAAGEELSLEQATAEARALVAELATVPRTPAAADIALRSNATILDHLSAREVEVLRLIAAGKSTQEIATALTIADGTVERHVTNLYGKIGARNRAEATSYAHRHGLAG